MWFSEEPQCPPLWRSMGALGPSMVSLDPRWAPLGPQLPPWVRTYWTKNTIAKTKIGLLDKTVPLFCFGQPYLECWSKKLPGLEEENPTLEVATLTPYCVATLQHHQNKKGPKLEVPTLTLYYVHAIQAPKVWGGLPERFSNTLMNMASRRNSSIWEPLAWTALWGSRALFS